MLQRAASNAYSWWWASHVRTKQSKWLDTNLKDMEDRVKCILFLLGEEADSFAKRAEMYYKRRPEVIDSVEEAYRAYRALAERYDHVSGELHKANHTIATAFPDQVQYALLEEDDDNLLPKAFTTVDPRKIHKSTVEGLMKKKEKHASAHLELKDGGKKFVTPISKENAHAEIGRLQKEILVLQTEKEFIRSSYESGIAKYWDLEKRINDMQEQVCYFQEEFDENAAIEDDEARALMTATAIKSCKDAMIKFQEQQRALFNQAMIETERVKVAREKLEGTMRGHGESLSNSGNSTRETKNDVSVNKIYEFHSMKPEKIELRETVDKIKEYFQMNSDLSVEEMAEKIDELVNEVVDLELMISSQTARINRLCLENNELEKSLQKLEEDKVELTNVPGQLSDKFKEAEEELIRVEDAGRSYHAEETIFCSSFTKTINSFFDVSNVLQLPLIKHQDFSRCMLTDEVTPSIGTEPSGEHGKTSPSEYPKTDEAAVNPQVYGSPGQMDIPETAIHLKDNQAFSVNSDMKAEKHCHLEKTEDLFCWKLEDKLSCEVASVNVETAENADNNSSDDNNKEEPEHLHEITTSTKSSVHSSTHSHEGGLSEQVHLISPDGPGEDVKQEDSKQDYSTPCNGIPKDNNEPNMKMDKEEDSYMTRSPTHNSVKVADVGDQEDSMIKMHDLLMNGLQDKERVLLAEYTSILRNYKNAKRKLTEVETKSQEHLIETTTMISELRSTNAMKDAEIHSLREILNSSTYKNASYNGHRMNSTMSTLSKKDGMIRGHRRTPSFLHIHQRAQSTSSISRIMDTGSSLKTNLRLKSPEDVADSSHDAVTSPEIIILEDVKSTSVVEMDSASPLEEKFRRDIDVFMEENLAFLMKFSMSFQQMQGFKTKYEQLQPDIGKLIMNDKKVKANKDRANDQHPAISETEATEKRLRELKIELQVWLEQNEMFKGELQCRFDSLCNIQAEIEEAVEMGADSEEGGRFTSSYQAAMFQGEVSNMRRENNKVSNELQACLDHVKGLQTEIEKVMSSILKSTSLPAPKSTSTWRNTPTNKSKVPLRMFLFPAKKKKPSLFACVNPAFQKQNSDMAFFSKMK